MFIFGWGHQMKRIFGPVFKHHCDHCNNDEYWVLHKISVWFTLFFIPVFPYEINYLLLCPVCTYGIKLDGKQFKEFAPIAQNNNALIQGKITEEQYNENVKLLAAGKQESEVIEAKTAEPKKKERKAAEKEQEVTGGAFCTDCGNKIPGHAKFCGQCGLPVT